MTCEASPERKKINADAVERAPINSPIESEDSNVLRTGQVIFVLSSRVAGHDPKQIVVSLALEIIEHVLPHSAVVIRRTTPPERAGEFVNWAPDHDDAVVPKLLQPGDGVVK